MVRTLVVLVGLVIGLKCPLNGQEIASLAITTIPVATLAQQSGTITRLAQPFTPSQRWADYIHRTYSPRRLGLLAVETSMDHAFREPACWDRGAASYITRYSRAFDRRMIRNTAEFGFGFLTGEDLRYRPLLYGPLHGRVWHSVRSAFVARMPKGAERPAYTRFASATVAELSTAHWIGKRPEADWVAEALAWSALDQIQNNLLDEFGPDLRHFGGRLCKGLRRHLR